MFPWHSQIVILSVVIALGVGLARWRIAPHPMRVFILLLLYTVASNAVTLLLAYLSIQNIFVFHVGLVVMYPLFTITFSYWHHGLVKQIVRWTIPGFLVMFLALKVLGVEELTAPPSFSLSVMSILLIIISLFTLLRCLQEPAKHLIHQDERFWIALGTFISYGATAFIYAGIQRGITIDIWPIHNILHMVGNICYLAGYIWMRTRVISSS